jgi:hypothetical protein
VQPSRRTRHAAPTSDIWGADAWQDVQAATWASK